MKHTRLIVLLVVAAWALCSHLGKVPLLDDPNEGEYAEVAREMVETGEWISPQLNYVLFLNKPPLTYWLVAASYLAFGVNELAARLPIALTALLIVFLVTRLGTRLFDDDTGLLAGLILLTCAGFFLEAHLLRPDLVQVAAMTASFLALAHLCPTVEGEVPGSTPSPASPRERGASINPNGKQETANRKPKTGQCLCGKAGFPFSVSGFLFSILRATAGRGENRQSQREGLRDRFSQRLLRTSATGFRSASPSDGPHPNPLPRRTWRGRGELTWLRPSANQLPALVGWQVAIAVGLMSKGMVAVLVPGLVCIVLALAQRDATLLRTLLHPRAWWLLLVLTAPWHVIMSLRHEGFLWDYVVNQHFLFFFDKKWPRDSVPVTLPVFWAAFALRLFPWTLFAPVAVFAATRRAWLRRACNEQLLLAWAGAVLLLFSAAASRMEHYCIPALPPMALLIAKLLRDYGKAASYARTVFAHTVGAAVLLLAGVIVVPRLLTEQPWLAAVGDFVPMARTVFIILSSAAAAAAVLAGLGRRNLMAAALSLGFLAIVPYFLDGLTLVAKINSSAPLAAELAPLLTAPVRVVYEAPIEYQNCAGFNFYLGRRLDLLAHPDFVPPPYLAAYVDDLYLSRDDLRTAWPEEKLFVITDPLRERRSVDGAFPAPTHIVGRDYCRLLISNRPVQRVP